LPTIKSTLICKYVGNTLPESRGREPVIASTDCGFGH